MTTVNDKSLKETIRLHGLYLQDDPVGVRADMEDANLEEADLRKANLEGAKLDRVNLKWAHIGKANLEGVHLVEADLRWAHLKDANLSEAHLKDAKLEGADLQGANLNEANLQGADLRGANIDYSNWPLWCGSLGAIVDTRIATQLAYHFCSLECDNPEFLEARAAIAKFANKFPLVSSNDVKKIGVE